METFNKNHFKNMPWKNGGGETLELFRLPATNASGFSFRLSCARVELNGPFSLFPGIDRILLLLSGKGFTLSLPDKQVLINKPLSPFYFTGETAIQCDLLEGACRDFNVMTDRSFGESAISIVCPSVNESFLCKAECDFKFIYDIESETLYKLAKNETFELRTAAIIVDFKIYA